MKTPPYDDSTKNSVRPFLAGLACGGGLILTGLLILALVGYLIDHTSLLQDQVSVEPVVEEPLSVEGDGGSDAISTSPDVQWRSNFGEGAEHQTDSIWQLGRIAVAWWKQDGLRILDEIYDVPLSAAAKDAVANIVLNEAIKEDYASTFNSALRLNDGNRFWILSKIAIDWGREDPLQALATIANAGVRSHSDKVSFLKNVITSWSQTQPDELMQSLASLPSSLRAFGEQSALEEIARRDPVKAAEFVTTLTDPRRVFSLCKDVARSWIEIDANEALEWVNSAQLKSLGIQREMQAVALGELAKIDPNRALNLALAEPLDLPLGGLELEVITKVANTNVDVALDMLPRIRVAGQGYVKAYAHVGKVLVHHREVARALELANEVEESVRGNYYDRVTRQWAIDDPVALLRDIELLPVEYRSVAARNLIFANQQTSALDLDQLNSATKYMSENDLLKLQENWNRISSTHSVESEYRPNNKLGLSQEQYDEMQLEIDNIFKILMTRSRR